MTFDAVLVRCRALNNFELRMGREHLIVHAADPVPPRPNLAVGHREQIPPQWLAEGFKDLLRRIERDAAHQQKLAIHHGLLMLATVAGYNILPAGTRNDEGTL